jgi:putative DNA primase/helicase
MAKAGELISVNAANVPMRAIEWLWPDRLAYGKLGLLGGLPDMGKGLITAFMMACITTQQEYPCDEGKPPRLGRVLFLSAEDDIEDTIIPRLKAAGADLTRIEIIKCIRKEGKDKSFSLVTDLGELRGMIDKHRDVQAIIIDPVASYTGGGKVNNHMNAEVRSFLTPLTDLAAEKHIFVLGVVHFNKKANVTSAMLRISDSLAYVAAARHVYVVVNDPEIEGQRLFVKAKNNLSTDKGVELHHAGQESRIRPKAAEGNLGTLCRLGNNAHQSHGQRGDGSREQRRGVADCQARCDRVSE